MNKAFAAMWPAAQARKTRATHTATNTVAETKAAEQEAAAKAKKVVDPLGTVILGYKEMYRLATVWYELAHELKKYSGDVDSFSTVIDGLQEIGYTLEHYYRGLEERAHELWEAAKAAEYEYNHVLLAAVYAVTYAYAEIGGEEFPLELWKPVKCNFVEWTNSGTVFNCGTGPIELQGTIW